MQDKNMEIRNFFNSMTAIDKRIYKLVNPNQDKILLAQHHTEIFRILTNNELYNHYRPSIPNEEDFRFYLLNVLLITIVTVQDLYISLNEKKILKTITCDEEDIYKNLKKCIANNNYDSLMSNTQTIESIIQPLFEMIKASALRKVELFKSLSDEDIKLLESLNPFFKEEYDHYNINITKEFLIKHINIWKKKKDYETAIKMITEFIIKIFNANIEDGMKIAYAITNDPEEQINILTYLNNNDFDSLAPIVRNIYENSLTEANKLN